MENDYKFKVNLGGMIVLSISVKEIAVEEYGNCAELVYGDTEVLVTLDFGPRIVSVVRGGISNLICNKPDTALGRSHGHKMRITLDKSTNGIYCDNSLVRYTPMTDGVRFMQTITEPAQLEVIMDVSFSEKGEIVVEHSVFNKSKEAVKLSIYTETPFVPDGFVFIPQGTVVDPERPSRILTLWDNCKWSDKRLFIGDKYVTVHCIDNPDNSRLKIGVNDTDGIVGYIGRKGSVIKSYTHNTNALYPFYNCSSFVIAAPDYVSIQMTSPFYLVEPDEAARHIETWKLFSPDINAEFDDEEAISSITCLSEV